MNKIAVLDIETDPFSYGGKCDPFLVGFYDGKSFNTFWDDKNCIEQSVKFLLEKEKPYTIFAHNGGKFDWMFYLPYLRGKLKIINNRIVKGYLEQHEIRDSYAILPFPLRDFKKDEIDYKKLERKNRNRNRNEIISYLEGDCKYLYELVVSFRQEFSDRLTIGSASSTEMLKFHKHSKATPSFDREIRNNFYFGGRCECFESGIIRDSLKVYDVNSMYPFVMKDCLHPVSNYYNITDFITDKTCFVIAEGFSNGAFPLRKEDGGLCFPRAKGRFRVSIHEWKTAQFTNTFTTQSPITAYNFDSRISFETFVSHFYDSRKNARSNGDIIHALFYKYILNSSYGRYAINSENFFDWKITTQYERLDSSWNIAHIDVAGKYIIWKKPLELREQERIYQNVATGASITGAARAILWKTVYESERPIYCDTDSILCRSIACPISNSELGMWKLESECDIAAIAGKKLYALFSLKEIDKVKPERLPSGERVWCAKKACKGGNLSGRDIFRIAQGATIEQANPVPRLKFNGEKIYTKRTFKKTV